LKFAREALLSAQECIQQHHCAAKMLQQKQHVQVELELKTQAQQLKPQQ